MVNTRNLRNCQRNAIIYRQWSNQIKADGKQQMYGRSGFKTFIFDDYQLVATAKPINDPTGLESIKQSSENDFDKIAEYDRKLSPYDRTHLLEPARINFTAYKGLNFKPWSMLVLI